MNEPTRTVERRIAIAASRHEVYSALLDPAALSRWMYATVQWKPQKGAGYRIDWQDTTLPAYAQGEILEMQEDRRIVLSWFMERDGCETTASFDLEEDGPRGTNLTFRHAGFPAGPDWQSRFDMVSLEWDKVLENLRFLVEEGGSDKHPFYLREQIQLPASRERVYAHWVGQWALTHWLASRAFIDPNPGGEIDLILNDGRRVKGTLRLLVPGKHIRLVLDEEGKRSLLGVSFWQDGSGSTMTVTQRSYSIDESQRAAVRAGWQEAFERLREILDRRPGRWPRSGARSIEITRTLAAPPDRVWKAIAEASGLSAWFCDRAEFTPRVGAPYTFLWTGYGEQRGEILDISPKTHLEMSWDVPSVEGTTAVEIRLSEEGTRTRFHLSHTDWGEGPKWDGEYSGTKSGWESVIGLLDFYVRHGGRGARRSFVLRRRARISVGELWRRLESPDAFAAWMGAGASIDPKVGGSFRARGEKDVRIEGHVTMADPGEGIAFEIESMEPGYYELGWVEEENGCRILVSGISYGTADSWPLTQRGAWSERLMRLGA
jgi:uncharacterized protein YndB with AHSA1/START domain